MVWHWRASSLSSPPAAVFRFIYRQAGERGAGPPSSPMEELHRVDGCGSFARVQLALGAQVCSSIWGSFVFFTLSFFSFQYFLILEFFFWGGGGRNHKSLESFSAFGFWGYFLVSLKWNILIAVALVCRLPCPSRARYQLIYTPPLSRKSVPPPQTRC